MSERVPGAKPVRTEDAFDVDAVLGWLAEQPTGVQPGREVAVQQFSGGASNLTFLLRFEDRDLILRRAPRGTKAKGAHDMAREYRIQAALAPHFPYIAPLVGLCQDDSVLGGDFYVMERVSGVIPRAEMPRDLEFGSQDADSLCAAYVRAMVELHSLDPEEVGLGSLNKGPGYVRRQVEGWSLRYRNALTPDNPDYEGVMSWLDRHQPTDVGSCVIHNDFKFDNLVLDADDPTRIVAMLDWEMATVGDPLMDLGGAMAFWVQADDDPDFQLFRRVPTHLPGMWSREQIVSAYAAATNRDVTPEQWRFYEVFGLFRLAVIAQQIYYRYYHGQTSNELYAIFGPAVAMLEKRLVELVQQPWA